MAKSTKLARTTWILLWMLCIGIGVCQAATTYYVDTLFTEDSVTAALLVLGSLSDSGSWSAINTALASGPVTVYFSACNPGCTAPETSTNQISLAGRTNTSTTC